LDERPIMGGICLSVLYLDDAWNIVPSSENNRREKLGILNQFSAVQSSIDHIKVMLENIYMARASEIGILHTINNLAADAYVEWQSVVQEKSRGNSWNELLDDFAQNISADARLIDKYLRLTRNSGYKYKDEDVKSLSQSRDHICINTLFLEVIGMNEAEQFLEFSPQDEILWHGHSGLVEISFEEMIRNAEKNGIVRSIRLDLYPDRNQWVISVKNFIREDARGRAIEVASAVKSGRSIGGRHGINAIRKWAKDGDLVFTMEIIDEGDEVRALCKLYGSVMKIGEQLCVH
jgi:hypothetical protein